MSDDCNEEFNEGCEAYEAGKPESDCPYPVDSEEYNAWIEGWNYALEEEEDEEGDDK